jgi:hypothetical protein
VSAIRPANTEMMTSDLLLTLSIIFFTCLKVKTAVTLIFIFSKLRSIINLAMSFPLVLRMGILTKTVRTGNGTDPLILPLFGRNLLNGRDKWQYYTVANSGGVAFNAKLPVSVNGRSCTGEYGCDSISNGDTVYVEGYDDTFRATIYENATLNYLPY